MDQSELQASRRILDVDVREVSLVDRAANLRRFVIIKRLEDDMENAGKEGDVSAVSQSADSGNSGSVQTETPPNNPEAVKTDTEKACGGKKDDEDKKKAQEEEEEEKKKAAEAKKAEEVKKAQEEEAKKAEDAKKAEEAKSSNQVSDQTANPPVQVDVDKSKRVTPARVDSLKKAALELLKLIGEIDSEAVKSIVGSFATSNVNKEKPMEAKPEKNPEIEKLEKELTETKTNLEKELADSKAKLEETSKRLDETNKKLEDIEKSRQPSKSVEGQGGTDKKETKKSFWSGVL